MKSTFDTVGDEEIIQRCLDGDGEQYALLVDRYKDMAYSIAYRMVGDGDIAKDLAQESFISAYGALEEFRRGAKFSSWLYRIVVNKCKDHLRAGRETVAVDEMIDIIPAGDRNPEQTTSARQTGDVIQRALNALPVEYRDVIVLKHLEELDYREIAGILGATVNALKVRAHRGREILKRLLEEMGVSA